ncbi:hypothetical protein GGS20DRAFT_312037 [Poronia punctata]|nr:hypothetical protein GGS20DRAFT_312037 [Poronia punctata]
MSAYYSYTHHHHPHQQPTAAMPSVSHNHHGGRNNRRVPRVSVSQNPQNSQKQFRGMKSMRELSIDAPHVAAFRSQFEASRSFDLEDDMEFCPKLLTENDIVSISSASSDRSSLSSGSPSASPTQHAQQIATHHFALNNTSPSFVPPSFQHQQSSLKLQQPAATRTRNAIPIINPANGMTMSSPPQSASPSRMHHVNRRW